MCSWSIFCIMQAISLERLCDLSVRPRAHLGRWLDNKFLDKKLAGQKSVSMRLYSVDGYDTVHDMSIMYCSKKQTQ